MVAFSQVKKILQADVTKEILKLHIYETGSEKPVIFRKENRKMYLRFLV